MKTSKRTLFLILFALLLITLSCRFGTGNSPAAPAAVDPAAKASPGEISSTLVTGDPSPLGEFVLDAPGIGLDQLENYRQRFTSTVNGTFKGQPYAYSETVERVVSGADETDTVEAATNGEPMYLFTARLGETLYSTQHEQQPCRAEAAGDKPAGMDLARKLPPIYGAALQEKTPLDGIPAAHYVFDEKAVPIQAGKNGKASGELWIAEQGGAVLKYELTVQVQEGDFTGEQTWSYILEPGSTGSIVLTLPGQCQTLLLDFPVMPDAKDLIHQPGFMRYTVQSSETEARQFFLDALPNAGWEPLPSTSADPELNAGAPALPMLTFVKPNPDGSGRVAVVQLTDNNGALMVIVQTAKTKAAVKFYDSSGSVPVPGDDGEPTAEPADDQTTQAKLPDDLPVYQGASIVTKTEEMIMFTTPDAQEKVAAFYSSAMEQAGWENTQEYSANGATILMWHKDSLDLVIAISDAGGSTMVVITTG